MENPFLNSIWLQFQELIFVLRHEHVIFEFGMCDLVNQNETDSVRIKTIGQQK